MFIFHLVKKTKQNTELTDWANKLTDHRESPQTLYFPEDSLILLCGLSSYLCELQVDSLGVDAMKITDKRKSPGSRRKVCRYSVLPNISQQQKNTQKYQNTPEVQPLKAQDTQDCLHCYLSFFYAHLISWTVVSALSRQSRTQPAFLQPLQVDITISGLRTWPSK